MGHINQQTVFLQKPRILRNVLEHQPRKRILFINDNVLLAEVIVQYLRGEGYECDYTHVCGMPALVSLASHYNLLLVDSDTFENQTWEFLGKVHCRFPNLPILLFSNSPELPLHTMSLNLRIIGHIAKPIDLPTLLDEIRKFEHKHQQCENAASTSTRGRLPRGDQGTI